MKVVILAGGKGSRISEYTQNIPKPMIEISGKPILWHIMKIFAKYKFNDFYLALGYKSEIIKEYFLNYYNYTNDIKIDLSNNNVDFFNSKKIDWKISLIETGLETMTGGRLKNIKKYLDDQSFFVTYGDGLGNINIDELLKFHKSHGKLVTVTAVRPQARFGEINIENNCVTSFMEKPQVNSGWINGGFFVMEKEFLDYIENESTILEKDPLELASKNNQLMAYKHFGDWHCMDTIRDKENLEYIFKKKNIFY